MPALASGTGDPPPGPTAPDGLGGTRHSRQPAALPPSVLRAIAGGGAPRARLVLALGTLAVAALVSLSAGCTGPGRAAREEPGPAAVARQLFERARQPERDPAWLERAFDPDLLRRHRAGLLEALAALAAIGPAGRPEAEPAAPDEFLVALDAGLPGGGVARYTVQVRADGAGGWRICWFAGPGVEWPPPARPSSDGLTVSAPPDRSR